MKKGVAVAFVCLSIFLLVSMPVVSAGWFGDLIDNIKDFFNEARITGNAPEASECDDSDGGVILTSKGTCTGPGTPGTDYCVGSTSVREYSCVGETDTCTAATFPCDSGQACNNGACVVVECGNNILEAGEECDDGNTNGGDGCNSICVTETFLECTGSIPSNYCDQFYYAPYGCDGNAPSACADTNCLPDQGQGELCDCTLVKDCDDLTTASDCNAVPACTSSYGYCGDGIRTAGEDCDDGDNTNGDGCSSICEVESGWTCTGILSVCTEVTIECGNNILEAGEECDDGNTDGGDGCSTTCGLENGICGGTSSVGVICTFSNVVNDQTECTTTNSEYCEWTGSACAAKSCSTWDNDITTCGANGCTWGIPPGSSPTCGNNNIDGAEECDGSKLGGETCISQGYAEGGTLFCYASGHADECEFNYYKCRGTQTSTCGNEVIDGNEQCDGPQLGGETCVTQGFDLGTLRCDPVLCRLDTSSCAMDLVCTDPDGDNKNVAGTCIGVDGIPHADECSNVAVKEYICSGDNCVSSTQSCASGYSCQGTGGKCELDIECGNNVVQVGETCDDNNQVSGDGCSSTCQIESGACEGTNLVDCTAYNGNPESCDTNNACDYLGTKCMKKQCDSFSGGVLCNQVSGCSWATCTDADEDGRGVSGLAYCDTPNEMDCDDADGDRFPGNPEICGNDIDEDCDGSDLDCASTCTDLDGDGYGNPASNVCDYSLLDCDDAVGSGEDINPGEVEVCGDGIDNNCVGGIDEGCIFYSINSLDVNTADPEVWENSKVPISCKFNVTSNTEDLTNLNVGGSCIVASVNTATDEDFNACTFVMDGEDTTNNLYYRSFKCDVGEIGDKGIRCGVNEGERCRIGINPSSQISPLVVTTPLTCPKNNLNQLSLAATAPFNLGPSNDLVDKELELEEVLIFSWEATGLSSSDNFDVISEAGLYELNSQWEVDKDIENISFVSNLDSAEFSLTAPSAILTDDEKYRIYVKTIDKDQNQFCVLNKYDVTVLGAEGEDGTGCTGSCVDFRYNSKNSVTISNSQKISFTLNGVTLHSIKVTDIFPSSADFEVRSDPVLLTLDVGEEQSVDLEGDGIMDILIKLTQITGGVVSLDIESLAAFETCTNGQIRACGVGNTGTQFCVGDGWGTCTYNTVGPDDDIIDLNGPDDFVGGDSDFPWVIVLIVGIVILAIFVMIVVFKRKFNKKVMGDGSGVNAAQPGQGPRGQPPATPMQRPPAAPIQRQPIQRQQMQRPPMRRQ